MWTREYPGTRVPIYSSSVWLTVIWLVDNRQRRQTISVLINDLSFSERVDAVLKVRILIDVQDLKKSLQVEDLLTGSPNGIPWLPALSSKDFYGVPNSPTVYLFKLDTYFFFSNNSTNTHRRPTKPFALCFYSPVWHFNFSTFLDAGHSQIHISWVIINQVGVQLQYCN